jgi:plastocyanin
MPFTWRIDIRQNPNPPGPAVFEFVQNPPQIQVGDQIVWSNNDSVPHFPTPVGQSYQFMANQIAPQSTSPGFAPGSPGTIDYCCSLHPDERASLVVVPAPQQREDA